MITIVSGGIFEDHRGKLVHNGGFDFDGVQRYYFIKHDNTAVIRGWRWPVPMWGGDKILL